MTADMMVHEMDDERTIEEEEMIESTEDFSAEVNSLQKVALYDFLNVLIKEEKHRCKDKDCHAVYFWKLLKLRPEAFVSSLLFLMFFISSLKTEGD